MMSEKALDFVADCNYANKTHEEKMALIELAEKLYPLEKLEKKGESNE